MRYPSIFIAVAFGLNYLHASEPEPGPGKFGLRLRLAVTNHAVKSEELHTIRAEMLNASTSPVTLVRSEWEHSGSRPSKFMRLWFRTVPEIINYGVQMGMPSGREKEFIKTLLPGGSLVETIEAKGNSIRAGANSIHFPSDGIYHLRAIAGFSTKELGHVTLESNEQPYIVGGSLLPPKAPTARILLIAPFLKIALLNKGSDARIASGDVFGIFMKGSDEFWLFRVKYSGKFYSIAKVEENMVEDRRSLWRKIRSALSMTGSGAVLTGPDRDKR